MAGSETEAQAGRASEGTGSTPSAENPDSVLSVRDPDPAGSPDAYGGALDDRRRTAIAKGIEPNNKVVVVCGTAAMVVVGLALLVSLINLWPVVDHGMPMSPQAKAMTTDTGSTVHLLLGLVAVKVTTGTALLLLVLIAGASGSLIHVTTSFADFVGNRRLFTSWVVWYVLRLIVGMLLALLIYFAFRGGFLSSSSQSADVNPYGIAALAGLAGLFSKQATDKLQEVFETLFQVKHGGGDDQRTDDLTHAAPTVAALTPPHVEPGSTMFKLTVRGEHFIPTSVVRVNGVPQPTRFISAQALEATLPDSLLEKEGTLQVTVFTGPPGGGESTPPSILAVAVAQAAAAASNDAGAPSCASAPGDGGRAAVGPAPDGTPPGGGGATG